MKLWKLLVALSIIWSVPSFAGTYVGLVRPQMWANGMYLYLINGSSSQVPACATRGILRLQEFDTTDQNCKNKYAMIIAAWYTQTQLVLIGTGNCTGEGDEIILS